MKTSTTFAALTLVASASAYPFMADYHKLSEVQKKDLTKLVEKRGAAAYSSQYPYTGAKIDGLPGTQVGGVQVPAPGDTDHEYQDPPPGAFRGPCPGLNAAANHGFLSRDGITTFDELVAAQQNVYNVGYDLAVVLATLGVGLDGDLVTLKLSIGGDATSQTTSLGLGAEGGLDTHNKFEADSSLTRNDYYLANGDDYSFNSTLFGYMVNECGNNFDRTCLSKYRYDRYQQSRSENGQFVFLPTALLLYGASSFLYELMPSAGNGGGPDYNTIASFFGVEKDSQGNYYHVPERIPDNWFNRKDSYDGLKVTSEILAQYLENPVEFGFNEGYQNFVGLNYGSQIVNGKFSPTSASDIACTLQQVLLAVVPSTIQGIVTNSIAQLTFIANKIAPFAGTFNCPTVTAGATTL